MNTIVSSFHSSIMEHLKSGVFPLPRQGGGGGGGVGGGEANCGETALRRGEFE
jgi:hypothetical protein